MSKSLGALCGLDLALRFGRTVLLNEAEQDLQQNRGFNVFSPHCIHGVKTLIRFESEAQVGEQKRFGVL